MVVNKLNTGLLTQCKAKSVHWHQALVKYSAYCRVPKQECERQALDPLQLGLWVSFCFLKGKIKEGGINHHLVTFLNHSFQSQRHFWFTSVWLGGPQLGKLSLSWVCMLMLYNSNFSSLTMILTTAILVLWFWLISVQLAQDWGQRGQVRE